LLAGYANAYQIPNTKVYYNTNVHTDGINNMSEDQAQMLYDLGLFRGRASGFDLYSRMTREEAAAMMTRFLGGEEEALSGEFSHPFTDVSEWADPYVGWLYQNGFTKGIGGNKYGGSSFVTMWQYSTFLSRAIRGDESGIATESEIRLSESNGAFNREAAVGLSVRALNEWYRRDDEGGKMTTAQWLCSKGVFSAEQLRDASVNVFPSEYEIETEEDGTTYLWRTVAWQRVAKCEVDGLLLAAGSAESPLPYLFASKALDDGRVNLYILDYRTMGVRNVTSYFRPGCEELEYIASIAGEDYLLEHIKEEEGVFCGALMKWDGTSVQEVIPAETLWGKKAPFSSDKTVLTKEDAPYNLSGLPDRFLIEGAGAIFIVNEGDFRRCALLSDEEILGWDGYGIVMQSSDKHQTIIRCIDAASGNVADRYVIPQDMEGEDYYRTVNRFTTYGSSMDYGYYLGEAGLYRLQAGRLRKITEKPVVDMAFVRYGAGSQIIFLSHDLGKRVFVGDEWPSGDQIFAISPENGSEKLVFECLPKYDIEIAGLVDQGDSSSIQFYAVKPCGPNNYDTYTYCVFTSSAGSPKIGVVRFDPGNTEMMEKTAQEYLWDEMDRLYRIGIGIDPPPESARQEMLEAS